MTTLSDQNQYAILNPERKEAEVTRSRGSKDDAKEQASFLSKDALKARATELKEQVVAGAQQAKNKLADMAAHNENIAQAKASAQDAAERAEGEWETVKRRGRAAARQVPEPTQRAFQRGKAQAKSAAGRAERSAEGFLMGTLLAHPSLRGVRTFIRRNNLQLPTIIVLSVLTFFMTLSVIRLLTMSRVKEPVFDIHSPESMAAWLKFHAGDYADKAVDAKDSLSGKAASILANQELHLDQLKSKAIDWRDIGMNKLGLREPTYWERFSGWITGRPVTWQSRVLDVLDSAQAGLRHYSADKVKLAAEKGAKAYSLKKGLNYVTNKLGLTHEEEEEQSKLKQAAKGYGVMKGIGYVGEKLGLTSKEEEEASTIDRIRQAAKLYSFSKAGGYIKDKVSGSKDDEEEDEATTMDRIRQAVDAYSLKRGANYLTDKIGLTREVPEPTTWEKLKNFVTTGHTHPEPPPSFSQRVGESVRSGVESVRSSIPSTSDVRQKVYEATHQSTTDKISSAANYAKNRAVHGAQEAAHIAQDRSNEYMDKAKYKAGL